MRSTSSPTNGATSEGAPLRIAVDFDGVLFDHVPYMLRGFRDAHGIDLAAEGLRFWDFFQYAAVRRSNLTWGSIRDILDAVETDAALHLERPRDAHARAVLAGWRARGHEVHVVTARTEKSRDVTQLFLEVHGIPHHCLAMEANRKTGYDVLVDDSPHNVLMAAADGGLALLMDHPYNRDVPTHTNPLRVRDFREVDAAVRDEERGRTGGLRSAPSLHREPPSRTTPLAPR